MNERLNERPPLANVITLGVTDFGRERAFYLALGWPLAFDSADFVVFELRGALIALFPVDKLAIDAQTSAAAERAGIRSAVIITVDSPEEVDALARRMAQAGGTVTKPPVAAEFFDGRDAYVADPEGNFWEIAWSPADNPVTAAARRAAGLAE